MSMVAVTSSSSPSLLLSFGVKRGCCNLVSLREGRRRWRGKKKVSKKEVKELQEEGGITGNKCLVAQCCHVANLVAKKQETWHFLTNVFNF